MLCVLQFVLVVFQRPPITPGNSTRHERDMESFLFAARAGLPALDSSADIATGADDVRFTPKSGHVRRNTSCPLCANSGHQTLTAWIAAGCLLTVN